MKVGKKLTDSSELESFEVLETKMKLKFSVEDEASVMMSKAAVDDDT